MKTRKNQVRSLILLGLTLKEIAMEIGVCHQNICRSIRELGFTRMYVTEAERAEILARRKATQT